MLAARFHQVNMGLWSEQHCIFAMNEARRLGASIAALSGSSGTFEDEQPQPISPNRFLSSDESRSHHIRCTGGWQSKRHSVLRVRPRNAARESLGCRQVVRNVTG